MGHTTERAEFNSDDRVRCVVKMLEKLSEAEMIKLGDWLAELRDSHTREALGFSQCEQYLLTLLALIHRDGGHYTKKNGIPTSVRAASHILVSKLTDNE